MTPAATIIILLQIMLASMTTLPIATNIAGCKMTALQNFSQHDVRPYNSDVRPSVFACQQWLHNAVVT